MLKKSSKTNVFDRTSHHEITEDRNGEILSYKAAVDFFFIDIESANIKSSHYQDKNELTVHRYIELTGRFDHQYPIATFNLPDPEYKDFGGLVASLSKNTGVIRIDSLRRLRKSREGSVLKSRDGVIHADYDEWSINLSIDSEIFDHFYRMLEANITSNFEGTLQIDIEVFQDQLMDRMKELSRIPDYQKDDFKVTPKYGIPNTESADLEYISLDLQPRKGLTKSQVTQLEASLLSQESRLKRYWLTIIFLGFVVLILLLKS